MEPNMVKVGPLNSLKEGQPKIMSLMGKKVGIFKEPGGEVRAMEMVCKHQGADLSSGKIENNVVTCPRHGWRYDLVSGKCLSHEEGLPLRRHLVSIDGEQVFVSLFPA